MKVVVVVGGVGGARFLLGVKAALGMSPFGESPGEHEVTAVVNTGDDVWMHGLRICPDLDTCMYTLGGGIDQERGWGQAGETWAVSEALRAYGADPDWFGLGDKDIATHLVRSRMLRAGFPLSAITEALCDRWRPGVRLLPMSDDRVETHVVVDDPDGGEGRKAIHFQEWWVRYRAALPAHEILAIGTDEASPADGVSDAIAQADVVLLAPSNPVVSVGTVLAVPGLRSALAAGSAPVVGVSPIIGGKPVRGMADACLRTIGVASTAEAVGRHYGSRAEGGLLDGWLVDEADPTEIPGVRTRSMPLLMTDPDTTAGMVHAAFEIAKVTSE